MRWNKGYKRNRLKNKCFWAAEQGVNKYLLIVTKFKEDNGEFSTLEILQRLNKEDKEYNFLYLFCKLNLNSEHYNTNSLYMEPSWKKIKIEK